MNLEFLPEIKTEGNHSDLLREKPESIGQFCVLNFYEGGQARQGTSSNTSILSGNPTSSIKLPMPSNIPYIYSAEYSNMSTSGVVEQAMKGVVNGGIANVLSGISENAVNSALAVAQNAQTRQLARAGNVASNTMRDFFFMQPGFRSFNFAWKLTPKNKSESDTLEAIRRTIAANQAPDWSASEGAGPWLLPSAAQIIFENANIPKLVRGVISTFEFNPTGTGAGWKAFYDGSPVSIDMSFTYLEVEPITKTLVNEGH